MAAQQQDEPDGPLRGPQVILSVGPHALNAVTVLREVVFIHFAFGQLGKAGKEEEQTELVLQHILARRRLKVSRCVEFLPGFPPPGAKSIPTTKGKVLVVDDQRDIVDTISFVLEQEGYQVLTAFNGHEALGVARIEQPDAIVMAVMLPKENGYQVARYIREDEKAGKLSKHVKILMLTARAVPEKEREEFLQTWSGADAFMYKPFDLDELVRRIGEMLRQQASEN